MKSLLISLVLGGLTGFLMVDVLGAPLWTACVVGVLIGVVIALVEELWS